MRAWILAREDRLEAALRGAVAARYGGPWSPPGLPAVYAYETSAAAALALFHLLGVAPARGLRFFTLELPDPLIATHAGRDRPREVGAHFLAAGRHLALRVPSRIAPATWLLLINPRHPAFEAVRVRPGARWGEEAY